MAEEKTKKEQKEEYIAIVRVRGEINIRPEIKDTMRMLRIPNKHNMAIYPKTPSIIGMIKKVKDYATFGEVSKDIAEKFGTSRTIKMHPPRGGFERKGIKVPYNAGGAIGNRGENIKDLIERMNK